MASVSLNTLAITVTRGDLNGVKALRAMCTSSSNTFLSVDAGSVFDMGSQPLRALSGQQTVAFTPDSVAPVLESFSLDLSAEVLRLTFDEVVRGSTLKVDSIVLRDGRPGTTSLVLSSGSFTQGAGLVVALNMSTADIDSLALNAGLGVSAVTTFVSLLPEVVRDMNSNPAGALAAGSALAVSTYTPDQVRPQLQGFTLNMNDGILVLTFSEVMNASSALVATRSHCQNSMSSPNVSLVLSAESTVVLVQQSPHFREHRRRRPERSRSWSGPLLPAGSTRL